jgi:hypothetical protein
MAYSQEPSFSWGMALPKAVKQQKVTILGAGRPVYYVVSEGAPAFGQFTPTLTLEAFKSNHDRIFTKDVTPPPVFDFGGIAFIDEKVVVFTYGFLKEQGGDVLIATNYDANSQSGNKQQLGKWSVDKMGNRGRFRVAQSPNLQHVLIAYEPDWKKGENEQLQLMLYNKELNLVEQTTQTLPYEWKRGVNNSYSVNNDGTAFILKRTVAGGEDNQYAVLSYGNGKKLMHHMLQPGGDKKIVAINSVINTDGSFVAAGYYSEDKKVRVGSTNYHGAFVFVTTPDGNKVSGSYVHGFNEKRKDMQLKYVIAEGDKYYILGQEERTSSTISEDRQKAMKGEYDYKYFANDIYADGFNATGKHLFSSRVHRNLDSKNDFGMSTGFFAAVVKDSIHIIFNDEESRYNRKKVNVVFFGDPLLPVLATIHATSGTMEQPRALFNSGGVGGKRAEMRMRPEVFQKAGAGYYIVRGENIELSKMGSVQL